jgi:hypothetical protein
MSHIDWYGGVVLATLVFVLLACMAFLFLSAGCR